MKAGFLRGAVQENEGFAHIALITAVFDHYIEVCYNEHLKEVANQNKTCTKPSIPQPRDHFGEPGRIWHICVVEKAIKSLYADYTWKRVRDVPASKFWHKKTPGQFLVTGILNQHYKKTGRGWQDYEESDGAINFEDGSWNHCLSWFVAASFSARTPTGS